jgi:threonine dehydrogenase-like Zn-dependent dehydrogenase
LTAVIVGPAGMNCGINAIDLILKGELGASFGYTQTVGGYDGGQAEYVKEYHLQIQ